MSYKPDVELFKMFCNNAEYVKNDLNISLIGELIKLVKQIDASRLQDGFMDILDTLSQSNASLRFAYDFVVMKRNNMDDMAPLVKYYSETYKEKSLESLPELFGRYNSQISYLKLI